MYNKYIKRILDVVLSMIAIVVLSPVFLITAICIKLSSPGPVLYYSERVGINKKVFRFYKFRSMHETENNKRLFVADQERLFFVGRVIRRLKIDELPQLFNIIKGEMSIVGPRPMTVQGVDNIYCGKYSSILSVKPGLTSAASLFDYTIGEQYKDNIAYINEILPAKQEMELLYVRNRCFLYDFELVCRTIVLIIQVVFRKKNFERQKEYEIVKDKLNVKVSILEK